MLVGRRFLDGLQVSFPIRWSKIWPPMGSRPPCWQPIFSYFKAAWQLAAPFGALLADRTNARMASWFPDWNWPRPCSCNLLFGCPNTAIDLKHMEPLGQPEHVRGAMTPTLGRFWLLSGISSIPEAPDFLNEIYRYQRIRRRDGATPVGNLLRHAIP